LKELVVFAAVFLAVSAVLLIVRKVVLGAVHRWAEKTDTEYDNIIVRTVYKSSVGLPCARPRPLCSPRHINIPCQVR
jgi:hypothetical protein